MTQAWPPSSGLDPITALPSRLCFVPPVMWERGLARGGVQLSLLSRTRRFCRPRPTGHVLGAFRAVVWSHRSLLSGTELLRLKFSKSLRYPQYPEKGTCLLRNRQCDGLTKPNWNPLGKVTKADTCFYRLSKMHRGYK